MRFLLNEGSLNVTTLRSCCLGFFLAWNPLILFIFIDAAMTDTFHVLVNKYFLNFRLALLIVLTARVHLIIYLVIFNNFLVFKSHFFLFQTIVFFSPDKYSLFIFDIVLHYQLNAFKIPNMVQYNHRSLMMSVNDAKYIHLLPIFCTFQSQLFILQVKPFIQIHSSLTYFATNVGKVIFQQQNSRHTIQFE